MPYNRLSTTRIARLAGCHPNTVRFYEQQGFLPPIRRNPRNQYRLYTRAHIDHMQLAVTAFKSPFPGRTLRRSLTNLVRHAAGGNLGGTLEIAFRHLALVQAETSQAESAVAFLENWAGGMPVDAASRPLHTGQAAQFLGVTIDALRTWERNGLVSIPRDPHNGYRLYGTQEIGRLRVVRMLRTAGYSITAILRMFTRLDKGETTDLRTTLDTPDADADIFYATDTWLTTLAEEQQRANTLISMLQAMIGKQQNDPGYYQDWE